MLRPIDNARGKLRRSIWPSIVNSKHVLSEVEWIVNSQLAQPVLSAVEWIINSQLTCPALSQIEASDAEKVPDTKFFDNLNSSYTIQLEIN